MIGIGRRFVVPDRARTNCDRSLSRAVESPLNDAAVIRVKFDEHGVSTVFEADLTYGS
jgi:hypothetical protein